jgi:predicted hydrocarbon binding protein
MSNEVKKIKWDSEKGSIKLIQEGNEERVFIISSNFIEKFKDEIIETSGQSTFKMIIRKLFEKLGEPPPESGDWESFARYNDQIILPVSLDGSNIPQEYQPWDGKTRKLTLPQSTEVEIWSVKTFQLFKEVMQDIMTEKGASAILNAAGKKAGMARGDVFMKLFGWKDFQNVLDTIDNISNSIMPAMGWYKGRAATQKGQDGKDMILIKAWNSYEAEGQKNSRPICTITSSFFNGISNCSAESLADLSAEVREVKCKAKGDDCCAFVIKFKDKGASSLDWKALEEEWQALDKSSANLKP